MAKKYKTRVLSLEEYSRLSVSEMIKEYNRVQENIRKNIANAKKRGENLDDILTSTDIPSKINKTTTRSYENQTESRDILRTRKELMNKYDKMTSTFSGTATKKSLTSERDLMRSKEEEYGIELDAQDYQNLKAAEKAVSNYENYFYRIARYTADVIYGDTNKIGKVISELVYNAPRMGDYPQTEQGYKEYKRDLNNYLDEFLESASSQVGYGPKVFKEEMEDIEEDINLVEEAMDQYTGDKRRKRYRDLKAGRETLFNQYNEASVNYFKERANLRRDLIKYLFRTGV